MRINIFVSKQQISADVRKITANSVNYLTACCHFDDDWSGLAKQIIFTNGSVSKAVAVSDGSEFTVPSEVLTQGKLELSAVGLGSGGEKRITTRKMLFPITVCPSGELTGDEPESYTPVLWEQTLARIGELGDLKTKAESLVAAINALDFSGGAGMEDAANKVTELSAASTDTQYPSAKCVYEIVGNVKALIDNL